MKKMLFACLCLSFAFPAIVRAGEVKPAAEQKRVAEKFISAIKAATTKQPMHFSPPMSGADILFRYLLIFSKTSARPSAA